MAATLIEAGADVNGRSRRGTPLYLAAQSGQRDIVTLLLQRRAEINASDDSAGTALHGAAGAGHRPIVELLLASGADANARTRLGFTPLDLAEAMERLDVAQLLREHQAATGQEGRGRPNVPMTLPRGPYEDSMPAQRPYDAAGTYGQPSDPLAVVADPNAIRRRVAGFAGLGEALTALEEDSRSEQRSWQQRRLDNRTSLLRAADAQFGAEMAFVKTTAKQEDAAKAVQAIDDLLAERRKRYDVISDVLREERRAALQAEREARRSSGRGRGRGMYATEPSTPVTTDVYRGPTVRDPNAPALDPDTEALLRAWQEANEDNRPALDVVTDTDLNELESLRQIAVAEGAKRTTTAIEGLMLARQQRRAYILERIAADEERQQRLEERANARGRGTTQGDTTTLGGRGRRGR